MRQRGGGEVQLCNWEAIQEADLLFNQMLIGVTTRKYARSVRLPDGDLADQARHATTKSSVSRRFVALSTAKLKEWLAADLSGLDLLVDPDRRAACRRPYPGGGDCMEGVGDKQVLAVALGATENAAAVKKVLRQAWDSPTTEQAERVLRNFSASIHEGLDEMLTVIRLGLPDQLRRSLG